MRSAPLALLLLTGCPYIFGPPELARRGSGPSGDSDSTLPGPGLVTSTGTGTGVVSGTPTGTTAGTPTVPFPPEITSATAHFGYGVARLVIAIDAMPGSLDGALLTVDDGVVPLVLPIPVGLADWDPAGVATVEISTGTPCNGLVRSWTLSVVDNNGRASADANADLTVNGFDHDEGDDPTDMGALDPPAVICGSLGNSNDIDRTRFANASGTWVFSLHDLSAVPVNRDLQLRDSSDAIVEEAATANDPDSLTALLDPLESYTLRVSSPVGGSGSGWVIAVHE